MTESPTTNHNYFGYNLAVSGDTLVFGFYQLGVYDDTGNWASDVQGNDMTNVGAAYVYRTSDNGATWTLAANLAKPYPLYMDQFGGGIAIDGSTILVGAPGMKKTSFHGQSDMYMGRIYVFTTTDDWATWDIQANFSAPTYISSEQFGYSMVFKGTTLVTSTPNANSAVYVISGSSDMTTWTITSVMQQWPVLLTSGSDDYMTSKSNDMYGDNMACNADCSVIAVSAYSKADPELNYNGMVFLYT